MPPAANYIDLRASSANVPRESNDAYTDSDSEDIDAYKKKPKVITTNVPRKSNDAYGANTREPTQAITSNPDSTAHYTDDDLFDGFKEPDNLVGQWVRKDETQNETKDKNRVVSTSKKDASDDLYNWDTYLPRTQGCEWNCSCPTEGKICENTKARLLERNLPKAPGVPLHLKAMYNLTTRRFF